MDGSDCGAVPPASSAHIALPILGLPSAAQNPAALFNLRCVTDWRSESQPCAAAAAAAAVRPPPHRG
eukprot:COSAG02_NODE_1309_length_13330_cov_61.652483_15_plen_67_part_00